MEKRRHPRMATEHLSVDVVDGVGNFPGMVFDLSRSGVCITELSKKLNASVKTMTVVVSGKGRNFKMNVRPRWFADGGAWKSVGAEILNPSPEWIEFVMGFEPAIQKEAWNVIHI